MIAHRTQHTAPCTRHRLALATAAAHTTAAHATALHSPPLLLTPLLLTPLLLLLTPLLLARLVHPLPLLASTPPLLTRLAFDPSNGADPFTLAATMALSILALRPVYFLAGM